MWMLHCELNESKPFHKLDDEIQTFIRQRRPKLQTDTRMSILSQGEEDNRRAALRSYRDVRMSIDHGAQRSKTSIVELSPDQAHTSAEDLSTAREPSRVSLAPLFHEEEGERHEHTQKQEPEQEQKKLPLTTETNFVSEKNKTNAKI
ncbi:unnamed protein product [Rotaria socialis]|uniref:Uncharacterized protein n=1 Tax=Rotaria socialis TaxID=392032 RepID=A0A818FYL9_9BILA|nr:unnamed protein product [Rotaria socialis]